MSAGLFEEFSPTSSKAWKQKIQADLGGAEYNGLLWQSNEGIAVRPFYHRDELDAFYKLPPERRPWQLCQHVEVTDEKKACRQALNVLDKGVTALCFRIKKDTDVAQLLEAVDPCRHEIHFRPEYPNVDSIVQVHNYIKKKALDTCDFKIYLNMDPIGDLARRGNWRKSEKEDITILGTHLKNAHSHLKIIGVEAGLYENAGANKVQQIAYALAHANEYLNRFGVSCASRMQFLFTTGSDYFFEIAKLRAFRILWQRILQVYESEKTGCQLFCEPTLRNKTIYDTHVNMLRTTTECMSAVLGGANTISNSAYDSVYRNKNEFGERIARNQLLILKNESYFGEVFNPVDGTYYIEFLTQKLAEKAFELFKRIENTGGFLKQLYHGTIQRKIAESARKEQRQFDKGEKILVGTNKYPDTNQKIKQVLERYPFVKYNPRKTAIAPIIPRRLTEAKEKERLKNEL